MTARDVETPRCPRLSADELREVSAQGSLVGLGHVALEWGAILGAICLARAADAVWATVVAALFVAARQHALTALAHEAAHGGLARGRWNLVVGEALVAWPLLLSVRSYRPVHLAHHRFLSTDRDPDWVRNRPDRLREERGAWMRARHLLGLSGDQRGLLALFTSLAANSTEARSSDRRWTVARLAYYAAAAALVTWTGAWATVALYWFLPLFTWFLVLMRLRGIAEHWAVEERHDLDRTRTLVLSPLGRVFFLPKNIGYHLEHHLYPSVPFHALRRLHARLSQDVAYREHAHVTRGLPALAREVARFRPPAGASS